LEINILLRKKLSKIKNFIINGTAKVPQLVHGTAGVTRIRLGLGSPCPCSWVWVQLPSSVAQCDDRPQGPALGFRSVGIKDTESVY